MRFPGVVTSTELSVWYTYRQIFTQTTLHFTLTVYVRVILANQPRSSYTHCVYYAVRTGSTDVQCSHSTEGHTEGQRYLVFHYCCKHENQHPLSEEL